MKPLKYQTKNCRIITAIKRALTVLHKEEKDITEISFKRLNRNQVEIKLKLYPLRDYPSGMLMKDVVLSENFYLRFLGGSKDFAANTSLFTFIIQ